MSHYTSEQLREYISLNDVEHALAVLEDAKLRGLVFQHGNFDELKRDIINFFNPFINQFPAPQQNRHRKIRLAEKLNSPVEKEYSKKFTLKLYASELDGQFRLITKYMPNK